MSVIGIPSADIVRLAPRNAVARRRVLVVGPAKLGGSALEIDGDLVVHSRLALVSPRFLGEVRPDLVVAPLIATDWDVLDLAEALNLGGYRGPLVIQSRPLPRADLVLAEVRALYPGIEVSLTELAR